MACNEKQTSVVRNSSSKPDQPLWTEALADKAYAAYRTDFQQLGYDRESWF